MTHISSPKELVLKDLIQNVHTLFDERRPLTPPVPSLDVSETTSAPSLDSFLSPEPAGSADVQAISTPGQHYPSLVQVGDTPVLAQLSFSSLLSDTTSENHLTPGPSQNPFIGPLLGLRFPSSQTLNEEMETTTGEKARELNAVETLSNSTLAPPEVSAQVTPSSVAEWRLQVPSQLPPQPEVPTIPQSPTESVPSSISDFPLSSATSMQTRMG